ncbi:MAG TPA: hypothetical protein VF784_14620 [Anaerolineales bacterium]
MVKTRYSKLARTIRQTIRKDPVKWAAACGIKLRPYQAKIALAIKDSIIHNRGLTFVVILPRQSGKNEVQRHLFAWLLYRAAEHGGTIVSVAPTFKPQTITAMERVRLSLDNNVATRGQWRSSAGFMFRFHKARLQFLSGGQKSRVVGATADLLLSVDEAQDIAPAKFDKEFDPMTASTNATRVFWGTAWTSQTLLAREARRAKEEQEQDGIQRLFFYTGEEVAAIVPEYAAHLERVVKEKGRQHPLVRTQYFNEAIDAVSGMFNAGRMVLIFSHLPRQDGVSATLRPSAVGNQPHAASGSPFASQPAAEDRAPSWGSRRLIAFVLDVGGMDESVGSSSSRDLALQADISNPGRDSTTLSVIEVDLSTLETLQAPTYRVVQREVWTGLSHVTVFGKLKALAENWRPQHIVVDATGVGEGLWAMLDKQFPRRVIPVKFTQQEKSEIGWRFLSIIETGRFRAGRESAHHPQPISPWEEGADGEVSEEAVMLQYAMCESEILPGPGKTLRWGVPEGKRGPDGELVHDDFVMADALVAKLDELKWSIRFEPVVIPAKDPLKDMSKTRRI